MTGAEAIEVLKADPANRARYQGRRYRWRDGLEVYFAAVWWPCYPAQRDRDNQAWEIIV